MGVSTAKPRHFAPTSGARLGSRRSAARGLAALGIALTALVALGCQPEIGDSCHTSVDCSQSGNRLCDVTQPGGY